MGEAARGPIGACDIWALGRAMWLNWLIPVQRSEADTSEMDTERKILEARAKAEMMEKRVFFSPDFVPLNDQ